MNLLDLITPETCLDTHKLQNTFGRALPHWPVGVSRMLTEIIEKQS